MADDLQTKKVDLVDVIASIPRKLQGMIMDQSIQAKKSLHYGSSRREGRVLIH